MARKPATSWGSVADWYDELLEQKEDTFQRKVIMPSLLRLMNIRKGATILDLACGQGFFARAFHKEGATVIGSDIAPELIDTARKHSPPDISYCVAPADDSSFLKNKAVDAITIILALQNIQNVDGVFKECARVLKDNGRIYLVLNHPAFRIPRLSSWEWDDKKRAHYRRLDGYLSESRADIIMHPGKTNAKKTVSFHRPLQWYCKLLAKHGLCITRCEEWISHRQSSKGPRFAAEDRARKEFPLFLFLEIGKHIQ